MEISGKVKVLYPTQQVSATFKKRDLVVTTDEQYPQHILIEFHQDKCDLLDDCQTGQEVKVSINLRGRLWTNPQGEDKYFNSIQGWRIEFEKPNYNPQKQSATDAYFEKNNHTASPQQAFEPATSNQEEHDDLPF